MILFGPHNRPARKEGLLSQFTEGSEKTWPLNNQLMVMPGSTACFPVHYSHVHTLQSAHRCPPDARIRCILIQDLSVLGWEEDNVWVLSNCETSTSCLRSSLEKEGIWSGREKLD